MLQPCISHYKEPDMVCLTYINIYHNHVAALMQGSVISNSTFWGLTPSGMPHNDALR